MNINIYRNPFIVGLWAPAYLLAAAVAVTNDFLMATLYVFFTISIIGAYVTEFPMFPSHYMNEVAHKTAVSSLLGMLVGMIIGLSLSGGSSSEPGLATSKFFMTWAVMAVPAYPLMVYLVSQVNKRDLDAEHTAREEKRKKRGTKHPPILNKDRL